MNFRLCDTVEMMFSDDYKKRFVAEYVQTKIRYKKLHRMTTKYEAGTLDFEPQCSLELLKEQKCIWVITSTRLKCGLKLKIYCSRRCENELL